VIDVSACYVGPSTSRSGGLPFARRLSSVRRSGRRERTCGATSGAPHDHPQLDLDYRTATSCAWDPSLLTRRRIPPSYLLRAGDSRRLGPATSSPGQPSQPALNPGAKWTQVSGLGGLADAISTTALVETREEEEAPLHVQVAPNPFPEFVTLRFAADEVPQAIRVSVISLSGYIVWEEEVRGLAETVWNGDDESGQALANVAYCVCPRCLDHGACKDRAGHPRHPLLAEAARPGPTGLSQSLRSVALAGSRHVTDRTGPAPACSGGECFHPSSHGRAYPCLPGDPVQFPSSTERGRAGERATRPVPEHQKAHGSKKRGRRSLVGRVVPRCGYWLLVPPTRHARPGVTGCDERQP